MASQLIKKLVLVLSVVGVFSATPCFAAVGFIAIVQSDFVGGANTSYSHASPSVTGSNVIGLVCINNQNAGGLVGAPTWNGVTMTFVTSVVEPNQGIDYMYDIVAPTSGTIAVSRNSGASSWNVSSLTYSGVNQSTTLDASVTYSGTVGTNPQTSTITTNTNNAWSVICTHNDSGDAGASTGTTLRGAVLSTVTINGDSGGPITPAGLYSMSYGNYPASGVNWSTIIISIAPAGAAPSFNPFSLFINFFGSW